jgi:hypothetical protein
METAPAIYNPDTRLCHVHADTKMMWIAAILTRMYDLAGQKVDVQNHKLMVRELLRDMETRYKLLAMEEVENVIGNGVRGDYGDYYGLSISTISKWFKYYMDNGLHSEYLASKVKELKLLLPEKTQLTDGEIEEIMISGAIRCFNEYQNNGSFLDKGSPVFDFLYKRMIINPTDEQIREYLAAARIEYKESIERKLCAFNQQVVKDARKEMIEYMSIGDDANQIQSIAKMNAMSEFFENLIENKLSIEDVIYKPKQPTS